MIFKSISLEVNIERNKTQNNFSLEENTLTEPEIEYGTSRSEGNDVPTEPSDRITCLLTP